MKKRVIKTIGIIAACIAFLMMALATASETTTEDTQSPDTTENEADATVKASPKPTVQIKEEYLIGEIANLDGTLVQIVSMEKSAGSDWDTPKDGYEYIIVTIVIKNTGDKTINYNSYDFKIQNSQGQLVDTCFVILDTDTKLNYGKLVVGGYISGTLVYEEPKNDTGLTLIYTPSYWDDSSIRFNLMEAVENPETLSANAIQWTGTIYALNEPGTLDGAQIAVTKVEKSNGTDWEEPKEGYEFIIVTIEIKNVGSGKLSYNPFYFAMANSFGQILDPGLTTIDTDTALESGELIEEGSVSGTVAFQQPINDPGLKLIYNGDSIFSLFGDDQLVFILN